MMETVFQILAHNKRTATRAVCSFLCCLVLDSTPGRQRACYADSPRSERVEFALSERCDRAIALDFDGNSDLDIVAGSFTAKEDSSGRAVVAYLNDGRGNFTAHTIDDNPDQQSYSLIVVDVDQDERADILVGGRESNNVVWYRGEEPAKTSAATETQPASDPRAAGRKRPNILFCVADDFDFEKALVGRGGLNQ